MNIYKPFIFNKDFLPQSAASKENEFPSIITQTEKPDLVSCSSQVNQLEYFQQQAKAAYKKSFYSIQKDATYHKFLVCWFRDMRAILLEHGITEQQLFKTT